MISVPGDTRLLLVSVTTKPARPEGRILVKKWSKKRGIETHEKFSPIVRGQVLDFPDVVFHPTNAPAGGGGGGGMVPIFPLPGAGGRGIPPGPGGVGGGGRGMTPPGAMPPAMPPGVRGDPRMMPNMRPQGPAVAAANGPFKVNYLTHMIVVDLRGGELLHGRKGGSLQLHAPGGILLQDPDGNLVVRDELDDLPTCSEITRDDPSEEAAPTAHPKAGHGGAPAKGGPPGQLPTPGERPKKAAGKPGKAGGTPGKAGRKP